MSENAIFVIKIYNNTILSFRQQPTKYLISFKHELQIFTYEIYENTYEIQVSP